MFRHQDKLPRNIYAILHFPSQANLIFWIITAVILGILVVGSIGPAPILIWPVAVSMVVLPLYRWLTWKNRELDSHFDPEQHRQFQEDGRLGILKNEIDQLAEQVEFAPPIRVVIIKNPRELRALGSFRRHYIFIGPVIGDELVTDLSENKSDLVARAALLHEIFHLKQKDTQRTAYARELLRATYVVIGWWMVFLVGWLSLALLTGEALLNIDLSQIPELDPVLGRFFESLYTLDPDLRAEIAFDVENTQMGLLLNFIVNAFLTVVLMSYLLRLFYWRRMMRIQEHLADLRVNKFFRNPGVLNQAWLNYEPTQLNTSQEGGRLIEWITEKRADLKLLVEDLFESLPENKKLPFLVKQAMRLFFQVLNYHPTLDERQTFIVNPLKIYGEWPREAVALTVLMLGLEILQVTPLIGYYTGGLVIHFATLLAFVVLATWILPLLALGEPVRRRLRNILMWVYGVRLGWVILNLTILLILAVLLPDFTLEILNGIVIAGWRFAGPVADLPVSDPLAITLTVIPGYLALQLLSLGIVVGLLAVYVRWQRRVQAHNHAVNWHRWHWTAVIALGIVATTLVLTPASNLIQGYFAELGGRMSLIGYAVGLVSVIFVAVQMQRSK